TMPLEAAVDKAVDACIGEGILAEFLEKQRAEVIAMSIYEYDQEGHMQVVREEGWEDGYTQGRNEGQDRMLLLLKCMQEHNEMHLADRLQDEEFLQEMFEKYQINER
ncbi:MAG: hypothetical protein II994_06165, partial [Lachnospiraceae bacterium]|nr:hypothetical protein [Lachnospiraceae bacterium]